MARLLSLSSQETATSHPWPQGPSDTRASLDGVLSQGEANSSLGSCNLSVLSFICVQGICFYLLVCILETASLIEKGRLLLCSAGTKGKCGSETVSSKADVFQASLSLSALVKTVSFELISFEVMMWEYNITKPSGWSILAGVKLALGLPLST